MSIEPSWQYLQYKQAEKHLKKLDEVNAKIIEEMCRHGSNNVSLIARKLNLPVETVRYRVNLMRKIGIFSLSLYFHYSHLGLLRTVVLVEASKPHLSKLAQAAELPGYLKYIARARGKFEGLFVLYAFPRMEAESLSQCYDQLRDRGLLEDYSLITTGDSIPSVPDFSAFDFGTSRWRTPWEDWKRELVTSPPDIPEDLKDPTNYSGEIDAVDVKLIDLIEAYGLQKFSDLGSKLGLTAQGVRHHYVEHLYGRRIAIGYLPSFLPLPIDLLDTYLIFIDFSDAGHMARFANTLPGKYFIRNYSKILNKNSLMVTCLLTRNDVSILFDHLYRLAEEGWILDFNYSMLDTRTYRAWGLYPEKFEAGKWMYDASTILQNLQKLISQP